MDKDFIESGFLYLFYNFYRDIVFGTGLKSIGEMAFYNRNIKTVHIPSSVETIGKNAFKSCNISDISFEDRDTELQIGEYAFSNIYMDETHSIIQIPKKTVMGKGTFENAINLGTIVISEDVQEIPENCFYECESLETLQAPSIVKVGKEAFAYSDLKNVQAGNISNIGESAFYQTMITTESLNSITQNAVTIESEAFANCKELTGTITLNNTITSLGEKCFYNCNKIETVNMNANIEELPNGIFQKCGLINDVNLASNIKSIGNYSFTDCGSLTMNEINEMLSQVNSIGTYAFFRCYSIRGVLDIPDNVKAIGDGAFSVCAGITEVKLNEGIERIGSKAFANVQDSRTIITFPSTVKEVYMDCLPQLTEAFMKCSESEVSVKNIGNKIVHYAGHKHRIDVECNLPGVKLINKATGEELVSGYYDCQSIFNLKVEIADEYANQYPELAVRVQSEGQFKDSELISSFAELNENNEFTVSNLIRTADEGLIRNLKIRVQKNRNSSDLVLRQFITKINGLDAIENREPYITTIRKVYNYDPIYYRHSKIPLVVEKGDKVTYKIRVYNEDNLAGKVNEVKVYLQPGLKLADNEEVNTNNHWNTVESTSAGTIIATDILANKEIGAYRGEGKPLYEDIELVCEVTSESSQRYVAIAEITDSNDVDSINGNMGLADVVDYKKDEADSSNYNSFVQSAEDDTDFETVILRQYVKVGYKIQIQKVDSSDLELLNGAKFNLYDENMNLLESKVTVQDGKLEFSERVSFGEGTDTYYIEEVETPEGYKRTIDGKLKLIVKKTVLANGETDISIICQATEEFDYDESDGFIPVKTAEQLAKIGSGENVTIDGKSYTFGNNKCYRLENDIDLANVNWTPIENFEGVLDGNGFKISNFAKIIEVDVSDIGDEYAFGLFKKLSGNVKNLNLENINIQVTVNDNNLESFDINKLVTLRSIENKIGELEEQNLEYWKKYHDLGEITYDEYIEHRDRINEKKTHLREIKKAELEALSKIRIGGLAGIMVDGTIENSTVSGQIKTNGINVGGFIGHTGSGSSIKMKNCINNANVEGGYNVAGLMGCAKDNIELFGCKNTGKIESKIGNSAGGLIGVAEPEGGIPQNIIASYANQTISIALKNKKIAGRYNIVLEKIEKNGSTAKYVDGAKFDVYDEDMNILKEYDAQGNVTKEYSGIEVQNGKLEIADLVINSLKPDVYYLKEVEAPEGYDIRINEMVKVVITKTWNGTLGKYEINVVPSLVSGQTETEISAQGITAKTGVVSDVEPSKFVTWKTNMVSISECVNEGEIISDNDKGAAGGIVGFVKGNLEVFDSSNVGKIEANYQAGGIVGVVREGNEGETASFIRCVNGNKDGSGEEGSVSHAAEASTYNIAGGIVALSASDTVMSNCCNYADINSLGHAGGILGLGYDRDLLVNKCYNYGDINQSKTGNVNVGGIVGTVWGFFDSSTWGTSFDGFELTKQPVIKIIDCEFYGNIDTYNDTDVHNAVHVGGILGGTFGIIEKISITQCKVGNENETILFNTINSYVGGIIGFSNAETTVTNQNHVYNLKINQDLPVMSSIGGIIGGIHYAASNDEIIKNVECNDNIVDRFEIHTIGIDDGAFAGIIGHIMPWKKEGSAEIKNNTVQNTKIIVLAPNSSSYDDNQIAGILGLVEGFETCDISNCKVINTDIIDYSKNTGCVNGSYIVGFSRGPRLTISNCEVTSTRDTKNVLQVSTLVSHTCPVGGFLGCLQDAGSVSISNCKMSNSIIKGPSKSSVSGVIGTIGNGGNPGAKESAIIDRVNLDNVEISRCLQSENEIQEYSSNLVTAGFVAYTEGNLLVISNSSFTNSKLDITPGAANGGLVGSSKAETHILSTELSDITVNPLGFSTYCNGAFGGVIGKSDGKLDINGLKMNQININMDFEKYDTTSQVTALGGVVGNADFETTITNVDMNDMNMVLKENSCDDRGYDERPTLGGIIGVFTNGFSSGKIADISNININDLNIETEDDISAIGGIIGDIYSGKSNITDIKIKEMNIQQTASGRTRGIRGLIGGVIGTSNNQENKIENIEIDGVTANVGSNFGGVIGVARAVNKINNCNIKNIIFNKIQDENNVIGFFGGLVGVDFGSGIEITNSSVSSAEVNTNAYFSGGVLGLGLSSSNNIIDNCNVTDLKITDTDTNSRNYLMIGGVYAMGKVDKISNTTVDGLEVNAGAFMSGLVAYPTNKIEIDNCAVKNTTLNDTDTTGNKNLTLGGILALQTYNGTTINNTYVDGLEIYGNQQGSEHIGGMVGCIGGRYDGSFGALTITNDDHVPASKNIKLINNSAQGHTGGIIGVGHGMKLENIKVQNITANGNYTVGGIIGCGTSILRNAIVTNIKTMVEDEKFADKGETQYVGGIAGISVENSKLNDVTVNSGEVDGLQGESIIASDVYAGGIAGVNSGNLAGVVVENITVSSPKEIEPYEFEDDIDVSELENEQESGNIVLENGESITGKKYALPVTSLYLDMFTRGVIRGVTLINGTTTEIIE